MDKLLCRCQISGQEFLASSTVEAALSVSGVVHRPSSSLNRVRLSGWVSKPVLFGLL